PVESHSRTYQEVSWFGTIISPVPEHPATWVRDWFKYLNHWHVIQHKVGSFLMMVAGVVEFQRARGQLRGTAWGLVLPGLLLGVAIAFGIHGGSAEHLPFRTEQFHHHIIGIALLIAAVSLALVRTGHLRHLVWQHLWAVLILCIGLDITLFYRLTPAERAMEAHHHMEKGAEMTRGAQH